MTPWSDFSSAPDITPQPGMAHTEAAPRAGAD